MFLIALLNCNLEKKKNVHHHLIYCSDSGYENRYDYFRFVAWVILGSYSLKKIILGSHSLKKENPRVTFSKKTSKMMN